MIEISEEKIQNIYLVKREFIRELDKGLGIIKKLISRVYSGLFTNIPSNIFYYLYFRGKLRENVINHIKIFLSRDKIREISFYHVVESWRL